MKCGNFAGSLTANVSISERLDQPDLPTYRRTQVCCSRMFSYESSPKALTCTHSYKVPVPLGSLELDGEASRVSVQIGTAGLATDGRKSDSQRALDTLSEHVCTAEVGEVVGTLPDTVSTGALSVNNSLGDTVGVSEPRYRLFE